MTIPLVQKDQTFGLLTTVEATVKRYGGYTRSAWKCKCACGTVGVVVSEKDLKRGSTKSCGCLRRKKPGYNFRHGHASGKGTPEYRSWVHMIGRCTNPKNSKYRDYGGRGIDVCAQWRGNEGFQVFLNDVGIRPSPKHSLGRKKNDGNYEPKNVEWQLPLQQVHNRRKYGALTAFSGEQLQRELSRRNTQVSVKWDLRFLSMARLVASWSRDPSTQVGAIITSGKRVVSSGFNGFPQGMRDKPSLYADRDEKLSRIIHAEINALLFARQSVENCTLYTWPFASCDRCCVQMLQAGITRFVWLEPDAEKLARWAEAFIRTKKYITESGAVWTEIPMSGILK